VHPGSIRLTDDGGVLLVDWLDDQGSHHSRYGIEWLRENAYAVNRADVLPPPNDVSLVELRAADLADAIRQTEACLDLLRKQGMALVRGAGTDTEALITAFEAAGLRLTATHFGRIEDLRTDNTTNQNTDQLGYTDAPVALHTDQPFLDEPPRYQLLHCMQAADEGGESYLVDGHQAAAYLRSLDRPAFAMLSTIPVRFHRRQKAFQRLVISPVIELRGEEIFRVRSSYFTMAPHLVPFDQMEHWYRSYNRFATLVAEPRHQYRFALRSGDFLIYDNFRMLHARTGFRGSRWVRGIYFD
jgi:gamma-butyrobetaine dioxygenase